MADNASATYVRVQPTFWNDPKVKRKLTRDEKHLLLYFMTSPHINLIGLYYVPLLYAANESEFPIEFVRESIKGALAPFLTYDDETEEILVHRSARHQIGEKLEPKDNRVKAVIRALRDAHSKKLVAKFAKIYADWPLGLSTTTGETRPSEAPSVPPSEGLPRPSEALSVTSTLSGTSASSDAAAEQKSTGNSPDSGSSHASTSTHTREGESSTEPPTGGGSGGSREFAIEQMAEVANQIALKISRKRRRHFNPAVQALVLDTDSSAWLHPKTAQPVEWQQRPELLALAGTFLLAGHRKDIRAALILALQKKLDPFIPNSSTQQSESPRNGTRSEPTPISALLPQQRQLDQFLVDTERITAWEAKHMHEARTLLAEAERIVTAEIEADPEQRNTGAAWKRALTQRKYRELAMQRINTANAA